MLQNTISNDNIDTTQRRRFPRRSNDVCMVNVDGQPYPVVDWSLCGVLFEADTKPFANGQPVNMILRFKTSNGIQDVKVTGEIVRKNSRYIATQFHDLPTQSEETLYNVIKENPADIARQG